MMKQNLKSNNFCQHIYNTCIVLFLLLYGIESFAQSHFKIMGKPINCKASVSTIDYEQYSVANNKSNAVYTWTITGEADFNTSKAASGTHVTVRFLGGLEDVILTVTESINNQVTGTESFIINKNLRPKTTSVEGPIGWSAVCSEARGVVYTVYGEHATSFVWTVPQGNTIVNQTTNSITVDFHGVQGNITVFAQNGEGCLDYQGLHPYVGPAGNCPPAPKECSAQLAAESKTVCLYENFETTVSLPDIDNCVCISLSEFTINYDPAFIEHTDFSPLIEGLMVTKNAEGLLRILYSPKEPSTLPIGDILKLQFSSLQSGSTSLQFSSFESIGTQGKFENFINAEIVIKPLISLQTDPVASLLLHDSPIGLRVNNSHGVWSGSGVEGFYFNPQTAGVGVHTVYYTAETTDEYCGATASIDIEVIEQTDCEFDLLTSNAEVCVGESFSIDIDMSSLSESCCVSGFLFNVLYDSHKITFTEANVLSDFFTIQEVADGKLGILYSPATGNSFRGGQLASLQFVAKQAGESQIDIDFKEAIGAKYGTSIAGIITIHNADIQTRMSDLYICSGTETTLTAGASNTYLWNTGETTQSITINPTNTTAYSVILNQGNCSMLKDSFLVLTHTDLIVKSQIIHQKDYYCVGDTIRFETTVSNPSSIDITDARLYVNFYRDFSVVAPHIFSNGGGDASGGRGLSTDTFSVFSGQMLQPFVCEFIVNNDFSSYTFTHSVRSMQTCNASYTNQTTVHGGAHLDIATKILNEKSHYCVGDTIRFESTVSNPSSIDITDASIYISSNHDFHLVGKNPFLYGRGGVNDWSATTKKFTVPAGQTLEPFVYEFYVNNSFTTYSHRHSLSSMQTCNASYTNQTTVHGGAHLDIATKILNEKPQYCVGDTIRFETTVSNPSSIDITDARLYVNFYRDFSVVAPHIFSNGGGDASGGRGLSTDTFSVFSGQMLQPFVCEFIVNNDFSSYTFTHSVRSMQTCNASYTNQTTVHGGAHLDIATKILNEKSHYCVGDTIRFKATVSNPSQVDITDARVQFTSNHDFSLIRGHQMSVIGGGQGGWGGATDYFTIVAGATIDTIEYAVRVMQAFTTHSHNHTVQSKQTCQATYRTTTSVQSCNQYALRKFTIELPDTDTLQEYIENPLVVTVFPVPVSDILYISSNFKIVELEIYTTSGIRVLQSIGQNQINVETLTSGTYFIRIKTEGGEVMKSIVVMYNTPQN